jgi:hypothetical protein
MNGKVLLFGVILFVVFWAFEMGLFEMLSIAGWLVGAVLFVLLLWGIGKTIMPKPPAESKKIWHFASLFVIILSILGSFFLPYLGVEMPAGTTSAEITIIFISVWLTILGGAMFIDGWMSKEGVQSLIGVFWLFSAVMYMIGGELLAANAWIHLAMTVGLPFIIVGALWKK